MELIADVLGWAQWLLAIALLAIVMYATAPNGGKRELPARQE
ncbi:hypothetical protein [Lysobacter sp. GCM10012299]